MHTSCQVLHTLSNLKQPQGKKAAEEKEREKSQWNFQSSLFQEKEERGSVASRNCSWPEVSVRMHAHTHTLAAPLGASKTSINAQSKIYSSEKQHQPKAFQGRQLGCRACGLKEKVCRPGYSKDWGTITYKLLNTHKYIHTYISNIYILHNTRHYSKSTESETFTKLAEMTFYLHLNY